MECENLTNNEINILKSIIEIYKKDGRVHVMINNKFLEKECNLSENEVRNSIFILKDELEWLEPVSVGKNRFCGIKLLNLKEIKNFLRSLETPKLDPDQG